MARPVSSTNMPCPTLNAPVSISASFSGTRDLQYSQANLSTDVNCGSSLMLLRRAVTRTDTGLGGGPNSTPDPGGKPVPESPMANVCSTLVQDRRPSFSVHRRNRIAVVLLGRMSAETSKAVIVADLTATESACHWLPTKASSSKVYVVPGSAGTPAPSHGKTTDVSNIRFRSDHVKDNGSCLADGNKSPFTRTLAGGYGRNGRSDITPEITGARLTGSCPLDVVGSRR